MENLIIEEGSGKDKRTDFFSRAFLNKPDYDGGATIRAEVSIYHWKRAKYVDYDSFSIKIRDCNEIIKLHGNIKDSEDLHNALFKLGKLIEVATDAKNFLLKNKDLILNKPSYKAKKGEKKETKPAKVKKKD